MSYRNRNCSNSSGATGSSVFASTVSGGVHTPHVLIATDIGDDPLTLSAGSKAVAVPATPERVSATDILVSKVLFQARKNKTTANTGAVYLGFSATAANNHYVLAAGAEREFVAPPGTKLNLKDFYVDAATAADAVNWIAYP